MLLSYYLSGRVFIQLHHMELFGIFERFAVQPPQSGLLHFGRLLLVPGGYTTVPTIQISHDMLCAGFYVCGVAFFFSFMWARLLRWGRNVRAALKKITQWSGPPPGVPTSKPTTRSSTKDRKKTT